jgi:hypothetical protein
MTISSTSRFKKETAKYAKVNAELRRECDVGQGTNYPLKM